MIACRSLPVCIVPLLVLAIGCGPSPEQRLIGSWKSHLELSESALAPAPGNPLASAVGAAMKDAVANFSTTNYEFRADKTFDVVIPSPLGTFQSTGTWEVVSHAGDTVTVRLKPEQGASFDRAITFIDADHFESSDDKGVLKFTRQAQ